MHCVTCGHQLGPGRFCTNCGHPVDSQPVDSDTEWRTGTAERPRTPAAPPTPPPAAPPPAWTPPTAARFPLFADETAEETQVQAAYVAPIPPQDHRRRSPAGIVWVAIALALLLVLVVGTWLALSGDDETAGSSNGSDDRPSNGASASNDPGGDPSSAAPDGLTAASQVSVPQTAGPGQDTDGNPVSYEAANMLDGVPETCWRMPGDGTGEELVITLPAETRLRSVGLINGYAKEGGGADWYHGNRRVQQVEWVFDDGTTVPQNLGDTTSVQSVDVDVTTTTITLRLVKVSAPGKGPSRRDFTAISDLLFVAR